LSFQTSLSPEEFADRFLTHIDKPRLSIQGGFTGSSRILGVVRNGSFRLQRRCSYRNSGLPYFYGQLAAGDGTTTIHGYFSLHPFVKAMTICMFAMMMFAAVIGLMIAVQQATRGGVHSSYYLLAAVGGLLFVGYVIVTTNVASRKEEQMYVDFFRSVFGAELLRREE
jgi:hypothetical protein